MDQILAFILFVVGLVMIIKGSDWFLDAVIWVSAVFKIPHILVGTTIVSICTTLPETFVSVSAASAGDTNFAFGNAIGSIVANTGLILAIGIIFSRPVVDDRKGFLKNGLILLSLLIFSLVIALTVGSFTLTLGLILIAGLIFFLGSNAWSAKSKMDLATHYDLETDDVVNSEPLIYEGVGVDNIEHDLDISRKTVLKYIVLFAVGIVMVVFGSNLLVDNGIEIANIMGVPSIVVGVVFAAFGTSLPELVTTITSIRKKASNLGVGNIIGANILNILQVIGITSLVSPINLTNEPDIINTQLPIAIGMIILVVAAGFFSKKGFKRWQGFVLLLTYVVFLSINLGLV